MNTKQDNELLKAWDIAVGVFRSYDPERYSNIYDFFSNRHRIMLTRRESVSFYILRLYGLEPPVYVSIGM